jgi:hypothetical protein
MKKPPALALNAATPVLGSATAETSAVVRRAHAAVGTTLLWKLGLASLPHEPHALQPVSVQPRFVVVAFLSEVPPTLITRCDVLG